MGLLSNRIGKESLRAGDHIYSWRAAWVYAHHGIYVGEDKVIHFTRGRGQEVGTGTFIDLLLVSSGPDRSNTPCSICTSEITTTIAAETNGVVSSCLKCFLAGGALYRFEYAVNPALFLAKARGGTCTLATSDPDETVVRRAKYLLSNGFRCYNLFKSNCEDFAIYCKTGLLVAGRGVVGQSGQAISIIGGPLAAAISTPVRLVTTNIYGMAVMAVGVYCASRYAADIGNRRDVVKVEVEDLTAGLASGRIRAVENITQLVAPAQSPAATTVAA
ncbi:protein LEAD-SENSITIVE 1-like [Phragmites australis]|uniref:protein LEAD-SENSITIVE 1-like n=1 Tax=Phragmites australis TaxID=29695 RepID=UPI002D7A1DC7|nr:protein LEAD-SENSITIVE 1-like [Phragmites australis]